MAGRGLLALVLIAPVIGCSSVTQSAPRPSPVASPTQTGPTPAPSSSGAEASPIAELPVRAVQDGVASWYGPGFHGRITANGETFDQTALTAAHRSLPLPSLARITRLDTGASVLVRVNDRGPYIDGRIVDLSRAAAEALGFLDQGLIEVRVEALGPADPEDRAAAPGFFDPSERRPGPGRSAPAVDATLQPRLDEG